MFIYSKFILGLFLILCSCTQPITSNQLLKSSINYHDPKGQWSSFNNTLNVTMESPGKTNRHSNIIINLPKEYFYLKATRDTLTTEYVVKNDSCKIALNGKSNLTEEQLQVNNLSCERAKLFKDYYTYLYGLPMKLYDNGTIIHKDIEQKTFQGKDYLVLKATYNAQVGSDVWYFYFNPVTYAMEVYQFYKTNDDGTIIPESGEYILLSDIEIIDNIKMPKNRAWYYNKDNTYLGTDMLNP